MGKIKENPKAVESRARKEGAKKASQSGELLQMQWIPTCRTAHVLPSL